MKGLSKSAAPLVLPVLITAALVALLVAFFLPCLTCKSLPDFSSIDDIEARKTAFFSYLEPFIDQTNRQILRQRERLELLDRRIADGPLGRRNVRWAREMAANYGLEFAQDEEITAGMLDRLRLRMDIIPPSLALAQAALESGWGTSRFAREGNNLYGIWCYEPGCGIIPKHRPDGATYEVASYRSPRGSFDSYVRNLNSNPAYEYLWQVRRQLRLDGRVPSGLELADGLFRYSQEQWTYVDKVKTVIRSNDLARFDPS